MSNDIRRRKNKDESLDSSPTRVATKSGEEIYLFD